VQLGQLRHPTVRLRHPIELRPKRYREVVTVAFPDLDIWGEGTYLTEAIEDFERTLIELYLGLRTARGQLGPALLLVWERVQQLVDERP
jgi:hypothetical protein